MDGGVSLDAELGPRGEGGPEAGVGSDAASDSGADAGRVDAGPVGPEPGRLAGITAAHNAVRARVGASPALAPLVWSSEIAAVAQAYANELAVGCADLVHSPSPARMGWGENLAAFTVVGGSGSELAGSALETVQLWESEVSCYTFGPFQSGVNQTCAAACSSFGGCGHYTQMVWRASQRLGCGVAECSQGASRSSFWVCNYDPPGNLNGQLPY